MKKTIRFFALAAVACLCFTSCNTYSHSMREPNVKVELYSDDFELSEQFSAEATTTRVLGIDWKRLFGTYETGVIGRSAVNVGGSIDGIALYEEAFTAAGAIASNVPGFALVYIPVIGSIVPDVTSNYALYKLMAEHPGYDVVFYPQFEKRKHAPILGTSLYSKTTVKVTARLAKMK